MPTSHPGTWECYLVWQKGIEFADGIKVANSLTLRWEVTLVTWRAQSNHRGPCKREAGELERDLKMEDARLLALKVEEEATSQGTRTPLEAERGTETPSLPWSLQRDRSPAHTLMVAPGEINFTLLTPRTVRK